MEASAQTLIIALFVGLIPPLVWLWFWFEEDRPFFQSRTSLVFSFFIAVCALLIASTAPGIVEGILHMENPGESVIVALLFGFLPPLVWLWFWLQEDRLHPEPREAIGLTFFTGMCVVLIVIPLQQFTMRSLGLSGTALLCAWAFIEEIGKFSCAYLAILPSKLVDEPIDPIIYMITIALGFASLENTLFLLGPGSGDTIPALVLTGNLRFFGATLLHVFCSSIVGGALALSFYMHGVKHEMYAVYGVILAGAAHSLFNYFVLQQSGFGILNIFGTVWLGIVGVLVLFQFIKRMPRPQEARA